MGKYFDWSLQWRIQRGFHGFHPSFEGLPSTILCANVLRIQYAHTGATHFSFKVAKSHVCHFCIKNSTRSWPTCTYNEPSERASELRQRFYSCIALSADRGWRYAISMRALIFLRFTRITSCFAAFAGRNGVTLLLNSVGFKHKSEF